MEQLTILLVWLASLAVATYLGYDRGRWEAGVCLGLLFGPLGAVAAGLMPPSHEWEARRRYQLDQEFALYRKEEEARARQRQQDAQMFQNLVNNLESQTREDRADLSQQLNELVTQLNDLAASAPGAEEKLRRWIAWLSTRAENIRSRIETDQREKI